MVNTLHGLRSEYVVGFIEELDFGGNAFTWFFVAMAHWRLDDHTLVVTVEPCPMCAMAAVWARVARIVYGAPDPKAGAVWSLYNIPQDERLNHRCDVVAGVREEDAAALLAGFFAEHR